MTTLKERKHKDYLVIDDINIESFKDDIASMEHPFFALKAGDTKERVYEHNNNKVILKSNSDGLATVFDKDIWIYIISKLKSINSSEEMITNTVYFTPYDYIVKTNRSLGGKGYELLKKSLSRLKGTTIQTNINHQNGSNHISQFGLIDSWSMVESESKGNIKNGMVKVVLPDWIVKSALIDNNILKINDDYFRIRKALHRRFYELARKHCGDKENFIISIDKFRKKTGSTKTAVDFRKEIVSIVKSNDLPDYQFLIDGVNVQIVNKEIIDRKLRKASKSGKKDFTIPDEPDTKIPHGFRGE